MISARAALAIAVILAVGPAVAPVANAQVSSAQTMRDFARMNALSAAQESSLKSRAERAARDARSIVDGSRITCDVTHARLIGYTRRDNLLLEVACSKSTGFIIDTSTVSPRAFSCRLLAAGVAEAVAAGKDVPKNSVCVLPENIASKP